MASVPSSGYCTNAPSSSVSVSCIPHCPSGAQKSMANLPMTQSQQDKIDDDAALSHHRFGFKHRKSELVLRRSCGLD